MVRRSLTTVIAFLLAASLAFSLAGCGSGGAKGVVNTFLDAIEEENVDKFLKCFDKDTVEELEDEFDEDMLESMLEEINDQFKEQYGKKWRKNVKITDVEKGDTDDGVTEYTVTIEFDDDEEEEIDVIKYKGKYYIDESF